MIFREAGKGGELGNWGRAHGGDRDRLGEEDGAIHTHLRLRKRVVIRTQHSDTICARARKSARKLGRFSLSAVFVGLARPAMICACEN